MCRPELAHKFEMTPGAAADFCKEDFPLLSVGAATWGGTIFVESRPGPPGRSTIGSATCGPASAGIRSMICGWSAAKIFEIKSNWKLNRRKLHGVLPPAVRTSRIVQRVGVRQSLSITRGRACTPAWPRFPLSNDPSTVSFEGLPIWPGLNATESQSVYFVLLFPNIA